jgi:hypothetical protein
MMIEAAANKIDAFLREYEEEGELFGPPVWLTPPPWYAFRARSIDKKTNKRLRRYGLPPLSRAFRIAFHYQDGQGHEDAGGYLRRKWLVALGFRLDEFEQYYYGRKNN